MSLPIKDHKVKNAAFDTPEVLFRFKKSADFVLKRWWIFAIAGVLGGIVGIVSHCNQKTEYKSHLIFALDEAGGNDNSLSLLNLASQFGFSPESGGNIFSKENIFEVMKSRRIIEGSLLSVNTFNSKPSTFIEYYLEISGKRKSDPSINNIHFPVAQLRSTFSYQQDNLLYETFLQFSEKYITARRPKPALNFYEVSVLSNDEKFTKNFTDKIVEETKEYYYEINTARSKNLLNTLEERVATIKGNLNSSISKAGTLKDANQNTTFSAGKVPALKQQVNIEVFGQGYSEMFKYMELARVQFLNKMPLMQVVDGAEYPMQKIHFGILKNFILYLILSILFVMSVLWLVHLFFERKI